jgi:hypothetical protein
MSLRAIGAGSLPTYSSSSSTMLRKHQRKLATLHQQCKYYSS